MTADDSEQRLWEALRRLSDAQLERVKQQLLAPHGSRISLVADDDNQASEGGDAGDSWRPRDLVHALVNHLHHAVHSQQPQAPTITAGADDTNGNQRRDAKPTTAAPLTLHEPKALFALASADFPSLQPPARPEQQVNATTKAKATKRRITTTLVSDQSAVTRPVLAPVAFPALATPDAQTNPWAKPLSPPPSKTRVALTEAKRLETPPRKLFDDSPPGGPKRVQPFPVPAASTQPPTAPLSPTVTPPLESANQPPPPALLGAKPKRPRRQEALLPAATHESDAQAPPPQEKTSAADFAVNVPAAKLYAFVITQRLVGTTCAELQLLTSLLFRATCADTGGCAAASEFCWRPHCLAFAGAALAELEPLLRNLGAELLRLVITSLADAAVSPGTRERLERVLQQREELRVAESARIGCKLPVETKASAVQDFALPFCEEMDSRLHFRSPTEAAMYANRERVRDGFLALLRQFQRQQHALVGIESAQVAASAAESAHKLLADVAPVNRWWFAKFFVLELLQVGANPFGESDKDLVLQILEDKLVGKNPDRLRKLHRRFSSHKQAPSAAAPSAVAASGASSTRAPPTKSPSVRPAAGRAESSAKASPPSSATFEAAREYFAENQQFFFHFLHSCDSYAFSQLVKCQLEAQFQAAWRAPPAAADPRKGFTDAVLRLKVLARFLGYLRFSPHWHNASALGKHNPALQAAKKEAVWTLENAESVGLDVKLLLEQSVADATLSKCVPWLCDYLTMLSLDTLSLATTYFQQLLVLLARIYRSPRLDALGETGVYVALQIERVFHALDFDVTDALDDAQLQAPHLQPSTALEQLLREPPAPTPSEDHLPFLYSQVFVQSCVSELEDLRGFLQTRAKPSHRVSKRPPGSAGGSGLSGGSSSATAPIRKLRPLQVVPEGDDAPSDELFSRADDAARLPDDDTLAEAVFKVHPTLRKVVEFVVEVVATNLCEHVLQHLVAPSADAFVQSCAAESGVHAVRDGGSSSASELEAATILFLQLVENRTARSVADSVGNAVAVAMQLSEEKVRASIPHLLPPACHPTLAQSVARVALARTRGVVRTLVPKSSRSEFLKRLTLRKKAVLKEAAAASSRLAAQSAAASAAGGDAASDDDSVVRALSTMFDAHADDKDGRCQEELVAELKQTSAQIFTLSHGGERARTSPDDWAKLHASLARFVRSFTTSLTELLASDKSDSPDNDEDANADADVEKQPLCVSRLLHELSVWDPIWRVFSSCLHVSEGFAAHVTEWGAPDARVLAKTVDGFTEHLLSLLGVVAAREGEDVETRRRTARLLRVVAQATESVPSVLAEVASGDNQVAEASELVQRLVLAPRARILAAIEALDTKAAGRRDAHSSSADTSSSVATVTSRSDQRQRVRQQEMRC
ncbi:hypothetical protein PybrP1_001364 [[Pythium] brassicae (nom. inval.)]|nr:hypothetical protein PybrP1_001364 [[Pythium] brassicae (nom. inval.)]